MKYIIGLILITIFIEPSFAQDSSKINNALLVNYYQDQRFDQATDYLKKIYPEPITDVKILKALAYCSQMNGKLPEAEAYYQRVYDLDSTNTGVLFSLGSINLRRGNTEKAEVWYKKITLKDSTNYQVYKQLARISSDERDTINEVNYLQKANSLNPEEPDVASELSNLFIGFKTYSAAEKILSIAIKADTENVVLMESLVGLEYHQQKWSQTVENCEKLVKSGDKSESVLTEMAIAYYNIKNYQSAIDAFNQIDQIDQSETTFYYTGACYKALNNYKQAILYFEKTIDFAVSSFTASYYTEIADTYETIKQYKKAELAYQKALQFTHTSLLYYSIANLYDSELRNSRSALKYYRKYLSLNPPESQKTYIKYAKSRAAALTKR